jgi:hypothetical protein
VRLTKLFKRSIDITRRKEARTFAHKLSGVAFGLFGWVCTLAKKWDDHQKQDYCHKIAEAFHLL